MIIDDMFGIRWHDGINNVLIGNERSVKNLAHIFESKGIYYTVFLTGCLPMDKPNNDFKYWVTELFPDSQKSATISHL